MNEQNELYKKLAECLRSYSDDRSKDQIYQQLINSLNIDEPVCFFVSRNNSFQKEMFEYLNDKNKDAFFYGSRNIKNHYLYLCPVLDNTFMIDDKAATANFELKKYNKKTIKKYLK